MSQVSVAAALRRLPSLAILLVALLAAAVAVCLGTELVFRVVLHNTLPLYTYPLRVEFIPFPDLFGFYPRFSLLHTEAFFTSRANTPFMYPAAAVPVYVSFYAGSPHVLATYLGFSFGALLVAALFAMASLVRRDIGALAAAAYVAVTMLCAYPIWFALSQGNIEIVIWVLLVTGIALYWSGRGYPACVCFGLAAAIKIYPVLFLVLPLYRKRWGQSALGAAVAVAYSVGSLVYVGPTFQQASRGIAAGLNLFRTEIMLRVLEVTGIDHSLFALYKIPFKDHVAIGRFEVALPVYLGLMAVTVFLLLATRVRHLPLANQLAFCVVVCVLFPPTSFEYTLLHMLTLYGLFLFLLLDTRRAGIRLPGLTQALVCCTVCLGFMPELIYHGHQGDGIVKSLALLVLLFTVLRYPFPAVLPEDTLPGLPALDAATS